jgi:hypothetical protein
MLVGVVILVIAFVAWLLRAKTQEYDGRAATKVWTRVINFRSSRCSFIDAYCNKNVHTTNMVTKYPSAVRTLCQYQTLRFAKLAIIDPSFGTVAVHLTQNNVSPPLTPLKRWMDRSVG